MTFLRRIFNGSNAYIFCFFLSSIDYKIFFCLSIKEAGSLKSQSKFWSAKYENFSSPLCWFSRSSLSSRPRNPLFTENSSPLTRSSKVTKGYWPFSLLNAFKNSKFCMFCWYSANVTTRFPTLKLSKLFEISSFGNWNRLQAKVPLLICCFNFKKLVLSSDYSYEGT